MCIRDSSPASQYGQLSRVPNFEHLDVAGPMRQIVEDITSGAFADEWDAERDAGFPKFHELKAAAVGPEVREFERDLRTKLGQGAT